ncbi:MFS transporter [Pseudosporangium ferrugineum]|uniref:EmrB/QacA subfamily drug resistance transporter n=1 Tax=Pseudosporangium ferrugineum TaxID=439699 RepID=A0A2T0SI00_9ACTN|nr:MFS transporter [Pseudosporangium ferrugineum]PRY33044.1 EmrB/QacA subfamily drug resistance transporter [Pseudosporangium ferrugineum]
MTELSPRRRRSVLAICCLSLFIVGLDTTIVNIALPSIRADLDASVSGLQWVIDAYTLVLASLLVLAGSTADRAGRRRTFQTGLALFTAGSLLCSVAPSLGWLIFFRALQAVGGSMLNPVAMSIITNTFTAPRERARAIGVWGGVVGLSMALGPVLGGALVAALGWRSIFWINVPVGLAAIALAAAFVPESRAARARRLDPVGQLLVLTLLAAVTFGIIEGPARGWTAPGIIGCFAVGAAALAVLIPYENSREEPLLDLRVFRSVPFAGATVIAVCAFGALAGFLFLNALYLQDVRGLSALHAGLWTLPMALVTAVVAPLSGRIVGTRGARLPLALGGAAIALAMLPFTQLTARTPVWVLMIGYVLFGLGFGLVNAPITDTAVSGLPRAQAGVAAALASTSRQVGAALGVAVIGAAVVSGLDGPSAARFAEASRAGWWIMAGCGAAVLVLGLVTTSARARATAAGSPAVIAASGGRPAGDG